MIDRLAENDRGRHEVIIKWQIFQNAPPNIPLGYEVFEYAYEYAKMKGYQTTASVFDEESLLFLKTFDLPFIKIAARPELYRLVDETRPYIISVPPRYEEIPNGCRYMRCIPEYPATVESYERNFTPEQLAQGISDHTEGFTLYHRYKPKLYEKHYVLERGGDNPDAGSFACVPEELVRLL
jgi:sialic acid synthase SpsE